MAPRTPLRALALAAGLLAIVTAAAWAALPQQSGTVDLASQSNVRIDGAAAANVFGEYATSAGDFDGDGITDLIVTNGNAASAWVIFGSAASGNVGLASPAGRAIKITGGPFHWAAGGRDVNGDGLGDVVLGDTDAAWVVFGSASHTDVSLASLGSAGFKLAGAAGSSAGGSVALAPDMNGDGKAEVVVGAFGTSNNGRANSGSTYVVFGTASTSTVDLTNLGSGGYRIDGAVANHFAGSVVAGGPDVTGDGVPDVLVGAPGAGFSFSSAGAVYAVGGKATTSNIDLNAACTCFRIDGQRSSDQLPRALAISPDMNGDGLGEALVSTDFADNPTAGDGSAGSAWVVFGKSSTSAVALAALGSNGFLIQGEKASDQAGRSLASLGDMNGDGKPDIGVGALFADNNSRSQSGSSYVVYGTGSTTTVSLSSLGSAGFRMDGALPGDSLGRSIGDGGDFNADGRPDVVSGAEFADKSGTDSGSAYVVFGFGPASFAYEAGTIAGSIGAAITPDKTTAVKRTGAATFAIAPPLPQGLSLDPVTGTISGTPTTSTDNTYTVTMFDLTGTATTPVQITIAAPPFPPPPPPVTPGNTTPPPPAKPCTTGKKGTSRADRLTGTALSDLIHGGGGNDVISGGSGNDCLFGDAGNDKVSGGAGNDKLSGGAGKDKLDGGKGKDSFSAGAGNDTVNSKDGVTETVDCGKGRDTVKADKKDKLKGCEKRVR